VYEQSNLKVHFAGCESTPQAEIVLRCGVKYTLYTVFPFIYNIVTQSKKGRVRRRSTDLDTVKRVITLSKRCIQDSGLFTLMFGGYAGKKDKIFMDKWYEALIEHTLEHAKDAIVVETDSQKVLGVESAWEYRKRMRDDLPNKQINVFHLEDGQKGLDRLIEFSDYLAISVPELRRNSEDHKLGVHRLACYIKNKKPEIDIHLLGCTNPEVIRENNFCTSSDSTSYTTGVRYGKSINSCRIETLNLQKIKKHCNNCCDAITNNEMWDYNVCVGVQEEMKRHEQYAGAQD